MDPQTESNALTTHVPAGDVALPADLIVPEHAVGLVIFAHGSGSSRHSTRNRFVAERLNDRGLATMLMDLLTQEEEIEDQRTRALRFDIGLLAGRVEHAVEAMASQRGRRDLPIGLFGASTGAAAALIAATRRPDLVRAVVSRGGRPDLAEASLGDVRCPTLLIVGGKDELVIDLNRQAMDALSCESRLELVPGATHLFEEPGALEAVADMAADWFRETLQQASST